MIPTARATGETPLAKVYLDSNVYKFSATALLRAQPRQATRSCGGREQVVTTHDLVTENPNDRIKDPELRAEVERLPQVAALADAGLAAFVISIETQVEISGLLDLDSNTGYFYGAERKIVSGPLRYSRTLYGGAHTPREGQLNFLRSLKHKRFLELQRITGAYQGERGVNRNQLLDAYHLWCAEHNNCDFFLSLDFKLAKVIERSKRKPAVPVVRPSQLLEALRAGAWH